MKLIGILLIIGGIIGIIMGAMMFGDIGIACIVGALVNIAFRIWIYQHSESDKEIEIIEVQSQKSCSSPLGNGQGFFVSHRQSGQDMKQSL